MSGTRELETSNGMAATGLTQPTLRCIGCSATFAEAARDFRCVHCGDLLEVNYQAPAGAANAEALQTLWRTRKMSLELADQSGVWRFREMLPILPDARDAVTLREGNTPLYRMPRSAKSAGVDNLFAK